MIGLMAIVVLGGLLALACWVFVWAYRAKRRQGKNDAVSFAWAMCTVIVLSLPITWDAIPTWIAFNYYADKEAGVKVFKTLEQWKAENPGVADALQPYGFNEKRSQAKKIGNNKVRRLINERFAYDSHNFDRLFLSVYARRYALVDLENEVVLVTYVEVGSGNSGGLASGGPGWWAFWLIHKPTKSGVGVWSSYVQSVEKMGAKK